MDRFCMAGLKLGINAFDKNVVAFMEKFASNFDGQPDMTIEVCSSSEIEKPIGNMVLDQQVKWVLCTGEEDADAVTVVAYICSDHSDKIIALLHADNNWSNVSVCYSGSLDENGYAVEAMLGIALFYGIIQYEGIVIHASAIEHNGKGILFTAPSDTGKTTQAMLWRQYKSAIILNGDRPALRVVNGKTYVYGIPWSGSYQLFENDCAPLHAIVILEQAAENSIEPLSFQQSLMRLMPRCFLPYHHQQLLDTAIENLEKLFKDIPVYLLRCRPDEEAVELVYGCVYQ